MSNEAIEKLKQQIADGNYGKLKKCVKCGEEWTAISINWLGVCPKCHLYEQKPDEPNTYEFQDILHTYWLENPEWNGALNTLHGFMKKKIWPWMELKSNKHDDTI